MGQQGYAGRVSCSQSFLTKDLTLKDDWSGVQDPVERRKRQNRVRQRAWLSCRLRYSAMLTALRLQTDQKLGEKRRAADGPKTTTLGADSPWEGYGMLIATDEFDPTTIAANSLPAASLSIAHQDLPVYQSPAVGTYYKTRARGTLIPPLLPYTPDTNPNRPTPTVIFPLSADHCLITLVHYNVVRAILLNMSILSLLDSLPLECSRSFGIHAIDAVPPEKIPLDLQPTLLQQSTLHPFWIKAIPFPAMRDNLIRMAGKYDSDDLRYDLGQALYDGFDDVERRGWLVWREPWSVRGWEVTEGFVKKWGFLLKGCPDVIESANYWREVRGEDKLVVET